MRDNLAKFAISKNSLFEKPRLIIMSCSTKNSLCSWREWCARETFGGEAANSERASERARDFSRAAKNVISDV